jgi:hypothetical protein
MLFWIHAILSKSGFLILDYINLPFHEFGHLFFGVLGERIGIWGGTIAQLAIPVIILISFWVRQETLGVSFAAFWFGENLLNISVYIADARTMDLPLVGGGAHDWNTILSGLKILPYCSGIAETVKAFGWIIMLASLAWLTIISLRRQEQ